MDQGIGFSSYGHTQQGIRVGPSVFGFFPISPIIPRTCMRCTRHCCWCKKLIIWLSWVSPLKKKIDNSWYAMTRDNHSYERERSEPQNTDKHIDRPQRYRKNLHRGRFSLNGKRPKMLETPDTWMYTQERQVCYRHLTGASAVSGMSIKLQQMATF